MTNRFDSIKNKPHTRIVSSKLKVLQEFKRMQDQLQTINMLTEHSREQPRVSACLKFKREPANTHHYDVQTFSSFNTTLPIYPRKTAFVNFAAQTNRPDFPLGQAHEHRF